MPSAKLGAALTAGVTVVTPNRRLARELSAAHDAAARARGLASWPAAQALHWSAWLSVLRKDVLAASPEAPPRLVGEAECVLLWRRVVTSDASALSPLADSGGVVELAQTAWNILHEWGAGGESWRGWVGNGDEPAIFAGWADRYAAILAREQAVDFARLPDELARAAPRIRAWGGGAVLLAGFTELSPQRLRLLDALRAAGMTVEECALPETRHAGAARAMLADPRAEIEAAIAWARDQVRASPAARVGIALVDLAERRNEVRALAEDILCAPLQWPGREDEPRPYELSLGEPLAAVPLVAAALDAIALLEGPLACGKVAAWLRSPYLAGAAGEWLGRARIEREWIEAGRATIALDTATDALAPQASALGARLREARRRAALPARAPPRRFVGIWRDWLAALGWPGERTLSSAEFQARRAFEDLLTSFGSIAGADLAAADAQQALVDLAQGEVFQPEGTDAPIRILGVLEAAGLEFDALWVAGLTADAWPPAPRPNPFVPLAWQIERDVPHATARHDHAFAQALTEQLVAAAPLVVLSHAEQVEDHPAVASALIEQWPQWTGAVPVRVRTTEAAYRERPELDGVVDEVAPAHRVAGRTRGGARLVEAQSDCPFQAFAAFRLGADPWPEAPTGLSALERGTVVHAALAAFWREVPDHAGLRALDPGARDACVARAVGHALTELGRARVRRLPPAVAAGEAANLASIVRNWLDTVEDPRPGFRVRGREEDLPLRVGPLELGVRLDRFDELADGSVAILDYKTGKPRPVSRWFKARPESPQLGLYALALAQARPDLRVRAVAYGHVLPDKSRARGIAADTSQWPALMAPADRHSTGLADWSEVEAFWSTRLPALAEDFAAGAARVDPRDQRDTCRNCERMALCRVDAERWTDGDRDRERDGEGDGEGGDE